MRSRGSRSAIPWATISAAITDIRKVKNRGIVSRDGAGKHIGGGTRVYDEVAAERDPCSRDPGLHRGSPTDPRFKAYSHQTSPEKIGIAYEVCHALGDDVIVSDVSSNTVSLLVSGGKLVGAFDACIFAPGTLHGALDVDAIRKVDAGEWTANEAFQHAGVNFSLPEERTDAGSGDVCCHGMCCAAPAQHGR